MDCSLVDDTMGLSHMFTAPAGSMLKGNNYSPIIGAKSAVMYPSAPSGSKNILHFALDFFVFARYTF